jgi:hypothetical protein
MPEPSSSQKIKGLKSNSNKKNCRGLIYQAHLFFVGGFIYL